VPLFLGRLNNDHVPKISWYVLVPVIPKEDVSMPLEIQVDFSAPLVLK
jgi:hypothetical protein